MPMPKLLPKLMWFEWLPREFIDMGEVSEDWMLCRGPRPAAAERASVFILEFICAMPGQRPSAEGKPQNASLTLPKGLRPVEGSRAPGLRKTFVAFFRFFHLARRFWNQT